MIVVLQSKGSPGDAETLIIKNPSQELLAQLRAERGNTPVQSNDRLAELRREMPVIGAPGNSPGYRAQSPR